MTDRKGSSDGRQPLNLVLFSGTDDKLQLLLS